MSYEYYVTSELESPTMRRPTLHSRAVRRSTHVYVRRRIAVASVLFSLLAAFGVGAGNVLANRGGDPASATAVRQATYMVQPGDTIWSIAGAHSGGADLVDYVDDMIELNGGSTIVQVGQLIALP